MADSALDINFEVISFNSFNGNVTVKFTVDSAMADSGRPAIIRSLGIESTSFNDSDILNRINAESSSLASRWQETKQQYDAGFNADSFVGTTGSMVYKTRSSDSVPYYNNLTQEVVGAESEGTYNIHTSYTVVNLTGSEKRDIRGQITTRPLVLWLALDSANRLDSVNSVLGADSNSTYDANEIMWKVGTDFDVSFNSTLATEIRSVLGYASDSSGDSDFASYITNLSPLALLEVEES